ncbi:MAG: FadR/GntR family transcriptional regulator [Thermodesulfobacteriota bacterium]
MRKEKIFEEIVRQIRRLIKKGRLKAGDKLPPERDLAQVFKVSRASVREAIRVLEAAGLVNTHVGDGTYVEAGSVEDLVKPLATVVVGGRESLLDIFSVRKMFEPHLASLAAERATADEISGLKRILSHQRTKMGNPGPVTEIDYSFHLFLAKMAKSQVFLKLYNTLAELINQTREEFLQEGDRPQKSVEGHEGILLAIEKRDPVLAKKAMAGHLRDIEREALRAGKMS